MNTIRNVIFGGVIAIFGEVVLLASTENTFDVLVGVIAFIFGLGCIVITLLYDRNKYKELYETTERSFKSTQDR